MNNSTGKTVELNVSFLPAGNYEADTWSDTKNSDKEPKEIKKSNVSIKSPGTFKVIMAKDGGFVGILKSK
jgi:hypothetical protein